MACMHAGVAWIDTIKNDYEVHCRGDEIILKVVWTEKCAGENHPK
jgi:hypothetical protein